MLYYSSSVEGKIKPSPTLNDVHDLIPRLCDYVQLHGKGEIKIAGAIKVSNQLTLRWGDCPALSGGPNVITKKSLQVAEGGKRSEVETGRSQAAGLADGRDKEIRQPLEAGENKEINSLLEPAEGMQRY